MGEVAAGKFFDAVVYGMILTVLSGFGLMMFSNFIKFALTQKATLGNYVEYIPKLFGMKNINSTLEFNLTHVLLFAIVIALLSLREPTRVVKEKKEKKE